MIKQERPLPIKASGGIRTKAFAEQLIDFGVKRIGASLVKDLINENFPDS